mmetsp:Transcript_30179/g.99862  ORF Transcript_30179/g.99862 Transcript_30179/m.99862 type:complete len:209 (+) Transcript_30179:199-825(+)
MKHCARNVPPSIDNSSLRPCHSTWASHCKVCGRVEVSSESSSPPAARRFHHSPCAIRCDSNQAKRLDTLADAAGASPARSAGCLRSTSTCFGKPKRLLPASKCGSAASKRPSSAATATSLAQYRCVASMKTKTVDGGTRRKSCLNNRKSVASNLSEFSATTNSTAKMSKPSAAGPKAAVNALLDPAGSNPSVISQTPKRATWPKGAQR